MRKRVYLVLKILLLWLFALGGGLFWAYKSTGEKFSMVWIDLSSGFVDCPLVFQHFKNKLLVISVLFISLLIVLVITEKIQWKCIFTKKELVLSPTSGAVAIVLNVCVCICVLTFGVGVVLAMGSSPKHRELWMGADLIAHACGGIDDRDYTNSVEAFELSYANGIRTIEVDFALTADDKFVCNHYWYGKLCSEYEADYVYTEEEFLNIKLYDKYTPMSVDMLFELMKKYEDVWIVTDAKYSDAEYVRKEFRYLLDRAKATDSMEVLDRFVVQLYNLEMYDVVEEIYSFPEYILTFYQMGAPEKEDMITIARYCKQRGISKITLYYEWINPEYMVIAQRYGLEVYAHTINDAAVATQLYESGVRGIYTDYLTP